MTNSDFAMYAARMARRAAEWAADSIMLKDRREKPISKDAADRYIHEQRQILELIEEETRE